MKLSQLHESYETTSFLRKVARELGYSDPKLFQLTEPGDPDHHDVWNDAELAIGIARQGLEDMASSYTAMDSILSQRGLSGEETAEHIKHLERLKSTPFGTLPYLQPMLDAFQLMASNADSLRYSAENVKKILMLINGIKSWANKSTEKGSPDGFKRAIAAAALKKLGIPTNAAD